MKKFSCKQKIILSAIIIVFLLVAIFLWFNIPRTFPSLNKKPVTEIEIFDGNHGKTIAVSEQDQISYITGELTQTRFRPEKLAFGFGTAYDLRFIGEDEK